MSDDPTKIASNNALPHRNMADDATQLKTSNQSLDKTVVVSRNELPDNDKTRVKINTNKTQSIMQDRSLSIGDIIKNRFVLDSVLGSGGMGTVYRALDLRKKEAGDNKPYVALKLLGEGFKHHPEALVTLQREARKTQELAHPNIVTVYDFDRDGDLIYLTMEELKGKSLADMISDPRAPLGTKQQLDVLLQISQGLAYAHSKGIVHSDLKPGNIFITENQQVKLLDFGIARAANSELYDDSFDAGNLGALTVSYASLEMLNRDRPDPSDDIYALGIIACEIIGNLHPYNRQDAHTALTKHASPSLPHIRNPFLRRLVRSSIALKRKDRIKNAEEFRKKLKFARSGIKTITIALTLIITIAIGNIYYLKKYGSAEINFNDLPEAVKIEFKNHINEANTALGFGDLQGAVINIDQAYTIHHSQKDMLKLRDNIVTLMNKNLAEAPDEKTKVFYQEQLEQLRNYPAFSNKPALSQ